MPGVHECDPLKQVAESWLHHRPMASAALRASVATVTTSSAGSTGFGQVHLKAGFHCFDTVGGAGVGRQRQRTNPAAFAGR